MTEEQWYEVIKRWEQSGLTQLQFCKQYEIDFRVFKRWRTEGLVSGKFNAKHKWTNKSESLSFSKVMLDDELPAMSMANRSVPELAIKSVPPITAKITNI